jgi:hypothetical protein
MSEEKNSKDPQRKISPFDDSSDDTEIPKTGEIIQPDREEDSQQVVTKNDQEPIGTTASINPDLSSTRDDIQSSEQTLQTTTENMEVHHHAHVPHSKKWKDYLYEFLMLFLAVTAGFFVENTREYYIEHQRASHFSKQLLADLRLDSVMFENWNRGIQHMQKGYDSLFYLLIQKTSATDKEVLETLLPLAYVFDVPATATTYNQMKSSGSLRYIENPGLTAHLQHYYDVLLPRSIKIADASYDYFSEHINPFYLKHIRIQDYDPFNDSLINKNPVIMERSSQTDQALANIMGSYRSLLKIQVITMNDPAIQKIKETMGLLKREYKLE